MHRLHPAKPRTGHPMLAALLGIVWCCVPGNPAAPASRAAAADDAPATRCGDDAISRSACMIRLVLADVEARYGGVDEGGISGIVAASSTSYVVSLPREERVQRYTYAFRVGAGSVALISRTPSVRSF